MTEADLFTAQAHLEDEEDEMAEMYAEAQAQAQAQEAARMQSHDPRAATARARARLRAAREAKEAKLALARQTLPRPYGDGVPRAYEEPPMRPYGDEENGRDNLREVDERYEERYEDGFEERRQYDERGGGGGGGGAVVGTPGGRPLQARRTGAVVGADFGRRRQVIDLISPLTTTSSPTSLSPADLPLIAR